ncbi:ribonuclease H-like domain-containing protein [Tribonema minus]|uniref:Ribonuclease H-like domain-containing protein n=1 Tax=Tribonema minus TaxID=303371 RepID=A0A835ZCF0_9STRA|nr:ribonuclease H-like domain-containing protein [Tribonema minus]
MQVPVPPAHPARCRCRRRRRYVVVSRSGAFTGLEPCIGGARFFREGTAKPRVPPAALAPAAAAVVAPGAAAQERVRVLLSTKAHNAAAAAAAARPEPWWVPPLRPPPRWQATWADVPAAAAALARARRCADTPLTLVETPRGVAALAAELTRAREFAFDVESHSYRSYHGLTCLLQVSTDAGGDFIVDPLAPGMWEAMTQLRAVFADPDVLKVGHAISGCDVPSLHRDFGIVMAGGTCL